MLCAGAGRGPRAADRRAGGGGGRDDGGGGRYLHEVRVPLELQPCEVRRADGKEGGRERSL